MLLRLCLIAWVFSFVASAVGQEETRGVELVSPKQETDQLGYADRHALVIGIDEYEDPGYPDVGLRGCRCSGGGEDSRRAIRPAPARAGSPTCCGTVGPAIAGRCCRRESHLMKQFATPSLLALVLALPPACGSPEPPPVVLISVHRTVLRQPVEDRKSPPVSFDYEVEPASQRLCWSGARNDLTKVFADVYDSIGKTLDPTGRPPESSLVARITGRGKVLVDAERPAEAEPGSLVLELTLEVDVRNRVEIRVKGTVPLKFDVQPQSGAEAATVAKNVAGRIFSPGKYKVVVTTAW